jgi:hypothetical protein
VPAPKSQADLLTRLKGKKPQSSTHTIVLDQEPLEAAAEALDTVERLKLFPTTTKEELQAAQKAAQKATAATAEAQVTLTLHGLPRDVYEALQLMYPPTDEQKAEGREYDVLALMPALIAATVVADPDGPPAKVQVKDLEQFPAQPLPGRAFTPAQVSELLADWNMGETTSLWNAAIAVCERVRNPTLPFGSRPTRG